MLKYILLISFVLVGVNGQNGADTTTQSNQGTTPMVIVQSAKAKGLPSWIVPGIIPALKSVYKSLDSATQTQVQELVNDSGLSVDKLAKKLGKITDGLSQTQQDKVRELLTQAEMDRREAGGSLQENQNLTDEAKEVFAGLIETVIDTELSLVQQCNKIKDVVGSSSQDTLDSLGIPKMLSTVDCSKLGTVLFT